MKFLLTLCAFLPVFFACSKKDQNDPEATIPRQMIELLQRAGFSTDNIQKMPEGYLVEKDIMITEEQLKTMQRQHLVIAEEEHYRTTNLVTGLPRTITVRLAAGFPASASTALNYVITAYNALNLQLRFQRVTTGGQIVISPTNGIPYLAASGFPSGGNPYPTIRITLSAFTDPVNTMTRILAHEIGHCIGFRHTDFASIIPGCSIPVAPEPVGAALFIFPVRQQAPMATPLRG